MKTIEQTAAEALFNKTAKTLEYLLPRLITKNSSDRHHAAKIAQEVIKMRNAMSEALDAYQQALAYLERVESSTVGIEKLDGGLWNGRLPNEGC